MYEITPLTGTRPVRSCGAAFALAGQLSNGGCDMKPNAVSNTVIAAALRVHSHLGPGVLESAYDACLYYELTKSKLKIERQVALPLVYEGVELSTGYRVDFIVENCLILELKCVENLLPVHTAQLLSYPKLSNIKLGLLINFHVARLKDGIRRVINGPESEL
jgi:GxxExxY protein